jgi:hypothetical protein
MKTFDERECEAKHTFRMIRQYMHLFELLLLFIRATRTGNWGMHLASVEQMVKYFFALDVTNYSGMMAWYLTEMYTLKDSDPDIWKEFEAGNWVVCRSTTPFCALGADEALEQQNRAMKVTGGLVGITQQPNALARYFLIAPELNRICQETMQMTGMAEHRNMRRHHHDNISAVRTQETAITKIAAELERVGNPFLCEDSELINVATKAVFTEECCVASDVKRVESLGAELYTTFKSHRIELDSVSLWAPIKRYKLKLYSSSKKKLKIDIGGSVT